MAEMGHGGPGRASDLALRENEIASIIQELEVVHTVACHMLLGKSWRGPE